MSTTYDEILTAMEEEFETQAGYSADDASDIGIRLKVLAGEIYNSMVNAEWIKTQMFPQTATGTQLEYHAQQRGLERKNATKASGTLTFSVSTALGYNVTIPQYTICATSQSDNIRYQTTQVATLTAGSLSVSVPAEAVEGGADGNCLSGRITVIISSVTGISTVTNSGAFTGGVDAESDDELRERLVSSYKNISNGTNTAFYKEEALKVDGVTSVGIARDRGTGTVDIYIWSSGTPSSTLISTVKAKFDKLREINVDVGVYAPTEVSCLIDMYISCEDGYSFDSVKTACETVIQNYFSNLPIGESFYMAKLGEKIINVQGVKNYYFTDSSTDKSITQKQKAVAGSINIERDS